MMNGAVKGRADLVEYGESGTELEQLTYKHPDLMGTADGSRFEVNGTEVPTRVALAAWLDAEIPDSLRAALREEFNPVMQVLLANSNR